MAWKVDNAYDSERTKVFWPQVYDAGTERIFHCSTLGIVEFMRADNEHKKRALRNMFKQGNSSNLSILW